ncbi:hypothetical protein BB561_001116 [Smittium simulii]|uniref:Reverse transcriptase zinc-binding domain-containing protein n=1 Tax=Smittium simulii TaxID=133385 RepID=A0A2T9YW11_9FUNG|nr:hypothetical protein BB561_001116 [Smittium simulii]
MSQARAAKLQTVIDEACRRVVHAGKLVALTRLREELRITPVNTRASALRERAYYKWPTLNTWIADLIDNPFKNRLSTWITGTKKWISRFGTAGSYGSARKVLEIRARAKDKSKISEWISNNDIGFSRNLTDLELLYPEHSSGIQKIIKIRIGCFNTALKLAKSKTLAEEYLNKCPFCNKFEPETVEHYLYKCSKWTDQLPGLTCSKLLGTLLGGELKFNYAGILKNASTPAVKSVLSTAQFITATSTTHAITFKELIVAPAFWTQKRKGMETLSLHTPGYRLKWVGEQFMLSTISARATCIPFINFAVSSPIDNGILVCFLNLSWDKDNFDSPSRILPMSPLQAFLSGSL